MPIAEAYTGHQLITTTEYSCTANSTSLGAITTDGIYQVFLDVSDMIAGDELQIRIYEKVQAGDTQRILYQSNLMGPQSPPIWVAPSLVLIAGWEVSLDCIAGTSISVSWSIRQIS